MTELPQHLSIAAPALDEPVKLVIWDLDNTVWTGTLMEGSAGDVLGNVREVIMALDARGILQSIASRNEAALALEKLEALDLAQYFLVPEINWGRKSDSVRKIAQTLQFGLNTVLFIDDAEFELAEVKHSCADVRTLLATQIDQLLSDDAFHQQPITLESHRRRLMYREEEERRQSEASFAGQKVSFISTLELALTVSRAEIVDIDRAEELTIRTNQLNSTGITYSRDELEAMSGEDARMILVARLKDRFGDYGIIALVVLAVSEEAWCINLILVSCRVLSRGVGSILLNHIAHQAGLAGKPLRVDFRDTGRNRAMKVALMASGFEINSAGYYEKAIGKANPLPDYISINAQWASAHCP